MIGPHTQRVRTGRHFKRGAPPAVGIDAGVLNAQRLAVEGGGYGGRAEGFARRGPLYDGVLFLSDTASRKSFRRRRHAHVLGHVRQLSAFQDHTIELNLRGEVGGRESR